MARNGTTLQASNVFRLATTTTEACGVLARQLSIYEGLTATVANPAIVEALRENDLGQIRMILAAIASQLKEWLELDG